MRAAPAATCPRARASRAASVSRVPATIAAARRPEAKRPARSRAAIASGLAASAESRSSAARSASASASGLAARTTTHSNGQVWCRVVAWGASGADMLFQDAMTVDAAEPHGADARAPRRSTLAVHPGPGLGVDVEAGPLQAEVGMRRLDAEGRRQDPVLQR